MRTKLNQPLLELPDHENNFSININETQNWNLTESKSDPEACCFYFSFDKKIQDCLEQIYLVNLFFNRFPALIGAFSAAVIATKQGVNPWLPYPDPRGVAITGLCSGASNLSMLWHFSISKTLKESRDARKLLRQQSGIKYVAGWSIWYFLWASLIGGIGQGELTAGGVLPFWIKDTDPIRNSIFIGAFVGFVLSRMSSIPRLIKRLFDDKMADDLYTDPDNLPTDEKIFYYLSRFQSILFAVASMWVIEGMYELKWLVGFDKAFGTPFCPSTSCSDTAAKYRALGFFPSLLSANGFYFSQERGLYHCYRACKLYWKYQEIKHLNPAWGKPRKGLFYSKLVFGVLAIFVVPAGISLISIQGLLSPGSRVQLPYGVALPYFLLVNATSVWRELEEILRRKVSTVDPESPLVKASSREEKTSQISFFSQPSNRVSVTGASINNGNHAYQNGYGAVLHSAVRNESWIWKKLKEGFSCCRSRRNTSLTIESPVYSRL